MPNLSLCVTFVMINVSAVCNRGRALFTGPQFLQSQKLSCQTCGVHVVSAGWVCAMLRVVIRDTSSELPAWLSLLSFSVGLCLSLQALVLAKVAILVIAWPIQPPTSSTWCVSNISCIVDTGCLLYKCPFEGCYRLRHPHFISCVDHVQGINKTLLGHAIAYGDK